MTTYRKFFKPFITAPSGLEGVFSIVKVLTILSYYRVLPSEYENMYFFLYLMTVLKKLGMLHQSKQELKGNILNFIQKACERHFIHTLFLPLRNIYKFQLMVYCNDFVQSHHGKNIVKER